MCVVFIVLLFVVLGVVSVVVFVNTHKPYQNSFEKVSIPISDVEFETLCADEQKQYFAVGNGDKYHVDGCVHVTETSQRTPVSQRQIDKGNYKACKVCIKKMVDASIFNN